MPLVLSEHTLHHECCLEDQNDFLKVDLYILMLTDTSPIWKDEVVNWIVVI